VQRIAVGEIFRDIPIVGQRYVGTCPSETHSISGILEQMWMKANAGVLATTNDTEQHLLLREDWSPSLSAIRWIEAIGRRCGILRIISAALETMRLQPLRFTKVANGVVLRFVALYEMLSASWSLIVAGRKTRLCMRPHYN
jgi:hypothetical protein